MSLDTRKRMQSLGLANEVRSKRSVLKQQIASGEKRAQPYVGSPPWWLRTAKIVDLLRAIPRIGPTTVHREILGPLRIPANKPIARLTLRQRLDIIAKLDEREGLRDELDWTTADYADPKLLVEWVERMHVTPDTDHPRHFIFRQAVREWRRGVRQPSICSVDVQLTRVGRHISEVPTEVWRWRDEVAA